MTRKKINFRGRMKPLTSGALATCFLPESAAIAVGGEEPVAMVIDFEGSAVVRRLFHGGWVHAVCAAGPHCLVTAGDPLNT